MNLRPFNHGSKAMHVKPIEKDKIQEWGIIIRIR